MRTQGTTAALVPAAGRGRRFGSSENKIWAELAGRPILWWSVSNLHAHESVDSIFVVAEAGEMARVHELLTPLPKVKGIVPGGASRQESVLHGLRAAAGNDYILVHDAARPLVSEALISRVLDETKRTGAAVPGLSVGDTLKRVDSEGRVQQTIQRENLWFAQTPQGAQSSLLTAAFERLGDRAFDLTDDSGILEAAGYEVRIVPGDPENLKVTHLEDIAAAERILASRSGKARNGPRTGFGYDVHALAEGRELWLGGVRIPHPKGLMGHSDADVILHAICDALVGAAGLGDIGCLFPDTDPLHKNRPSLDFLREVSDRISTCGWRVGNIDVTLLAEEPRIGPYRSQMESVIADGLSIAPTQVNIKATTSEGLGFVGRREGMACWAVATLVG